MKIPIKVYTTYTKETVQFVADLYRQGKHLENVNGQLYIVEII